MYDVAANDGFASVGVDHGTPVVAVTSIEAWRNAVRVSHFPPGTAGKRLGVDQTTVSRWLAALEAEILARSRLALVTNSSHTLLSAARAGLELAVLPTFMGRLYHDLVRVSDVLFEGQHWLVLHPAFRRDPKVRALADFLKRVARGPGGLDDGVE